MQFFLCGLGLVMLTAGCGSKKPSPTEPAPVPQPATTAAPAPTPSPSPAPAPAAPAPTPRPPPAAAPAAPSTAAAPFNIGRVVKLPPPGTPRSMQEVRQLAARRLVAAHPDATYMRKPVQPLMGVPVLRVELNADGSVRRVIVLREPQEAKHTIQMAIDAVHRAAPYGDVSRLPKPWEFVETFLYEYNGRFKPMTLDR